jgi:hypothetical protein
LIPALVRVHRGERAYNDEAMVDARPWQGRVLVKSKRQAV